MTKTPRLRKVELIKPKKMSLKDWNRLPLKAKKVICILEEDSKDPKLMAEIKRFIKKTTS